MGKIWYVIMLKGIALSSKFCFIWSVLSYSSHTSEYHALVTYTEYHSKSVNP